MTHRRRPYELDNRDQSETWIWIEEYQSSNGFIDIHPAETMANMIENCYGEDVLFLFDRFQAYLNTLPQEGIRVDVDMDHIERFRDFLSDMIDESRRARASGKPIDPDTGEEHDK